MNAVGCVRSIEEFHVLKNTFVCVSYYVTMCRSTKGGRGGSQTKPVSQLIGDSTISPFRG